MRIMAFALGALLIAGSQDGPGVEILLRPGDMTWKDGPPSLPKGSKFAVVSGDPAKDGPFVMRLKFPADYKIMPHSHPVDEHLTILNGTFFVSRGDTFDPQKVKDLPEGSYAQLPARSNHFALTKGEVTLQLHGMGPWSLKYANPADDPRQEKK
jgi:mannose-6-phosphate isomerase-like protein (cupin superfamily)